MEYKIQENEVFVNYPAMKMLCVLLRFIPYAEWHSLEEKILRLVCIFFILTL